MLTIKIGIADDHPILRSGLKLFLNDQSGFSVIGEVSNGTEAINLVRTTQVDVLLMDIAMPQRDGFDVMQRLRNNFPDTAVLVLSGFPEATHGVPMMRRGAKGYLNKGCEPGALVDAIRRVAQGHIYLSPALAQFAAEDLLDEKGRPAHELLTERELQIFVKLAQGYKSGVIADQLSLSMKTVSSYRSALMAKMSLASNSAVTYYALKHGLID